MNSVPSPRASPIAWPHRQPAILSFISSMLCSTVVLNFTYWLFQLHPGLQGWLPDTDTSSFSRLPMLPATYLFLNLPLYIRTSANFPVSYTLLILIINRPSKDTSIFYTEIIQQSLVTVPSGQTCIGKIAVHSSPVLLAVIGKISPEILLQR